MHAQSWEVLKSTILGGSEKSFHPSRPTQVSVSIRGRACGNRACTAARPLCTGLGQALAAVAARRAAGVRRRLQECNLAARVAWEAWADSPAIGHRPEESRAFEALLETNR